MKTTLKCKIEGIIFGETGPGKVVISGLNDRSSGIPGPLHVPVGSTFEIELSSFDGMKVTILPDDN